MAEKDCHKTMHLRTHNTAHRMELDFSDGIAHANAQQNTLVNYDRILRRPSRPFAVHIPGKRVYALCSAVGAQIRFVHRLLEPNRVTIVRI